MIQVKTIEKQRQGTSKIENFINVLPDPIFVIDHFGIVKSVNQAILKITNFKSTELVDNHISQFRAVTKSFRFKLLKEIGLLVKGQSIANFDIDLERADGEVVNFEAQPRLYNNGAVQVVVLLKDKTSITENKAKVRLLSQITKQSPASIVVTDLDGTIEYVNETFEKITGYQSDEVVGRRINILSSKQTPKKEYIRLWDTITSGKKWEGVFHNKKKNGQLFWERAIISPMLDDNGAITNYLAEKWDITEQKHVKEKLILSNKELDTFFYKTSHDLKGPLASTLGLLEVIKMETEGKGLDTYLQLMSQSLLGLQKILDDLVGITEIRMGNIVTSKIDFNAIVNEVIAPYKTIFGEAVNFSCQINCSQSFYSDSNFIEKVLGILFSNATKFRKNGTDDFIKLSVNQAGNRIEILLEDNGIGIHKKLKPKIFEMFSKSQRQNDHGSGLGLYIAKTAIEILGGEIDLRSNYTEGTQVQISLPNLNYEKALEEIANHAKMISK